MLIPQFGGDGLFAFMREFFRNLHQIIVAELQFILGEPAEITAEEDWFRQFFRALK